MVRLNDLRVVRIIESSASLDDQVDRHVLDAALHESLHWIAVRERLTQWFAKDGVTRAQVDDVCEHITWQQVAAALRRPLAQQFLDRSKERTGHKAKLLDTLARVTKHHRRTIFLGRNAEVGVDAAWFPFVVGDRVAEAIAEAALSSRHDIDDHPIDDVFEEVSPVAALRLPHIAPTTPMARGGILGLATAIETGCWSWLRTCFYPMGDGPHDPVVAAAAWNAVEQIAVLAASVICVEGAKADRAALILADPMAVAATPKDAAWLVRSALADRCIHTMAKDMAIARILTLPKCVAAGKATVTVDDYGTIAFGIGWLGKYEVEGSIQIGGGVKKADKSASSDDDSSSDITAAVVQDVCKYSPYALDIVMGVLSLVLEDVTVRSQPGRAGASTAHLAPTRIVWDQLLDRIQWKKHGRSDRTLRALHRDTFGVLRRLSGTQLTVRRTDAATNDGPTTFVEPLLNVVLLGDNRSRGRADSFVGGDFLMGRLLSEALFRRDTLQPAIIDAGHLFRGGDIGDVDGNGATTIERQCYQLLALAIDSRSREAIRSGRTTVHLDDHDVLREVGISIFAPMGASKANRYDYRARYARRMDALLSRMHDIGHIGQADRLDGGWSVPISPGMVQVITALGRAEARVGRDAGRARIR